MKIIIPRIIISKLFEHSLLEDPDECCGLLLGNDEKVIEIRNLNNVHDNPMTRYEIDNKDLMKAQKYCDNNNMDIFVNEIVKLKLGNSVVVVRNS